MRDAGQEISLYRGALPSANSESLAQTAGRAHFSDTSGDPHRDADAAPGVLNSMDPMDREVVVLRHFEELNNVETAEGARHRNVGGQQTLHSRDPSTQVRARNRAGILFLTLRRRSMPSSDVSRDVLLEQLAAEFVERHRCGEFPPLKSMPCSILKSPRISAICSPPW